MKQRSLLLRLHNLSTFETNEDPAFDIIFREAGRTGKSVSPTVAKASPINNSFENRTTELPSTVEFETIEDASHLADDVSVEWAMGDDDAVDSSSTDFYRIQTVAPLESDAMPSLYSFYFEDTPMNLCDDENSISLHDDVSLEEADYCLDNIKDNPEGFWSHSTTMMTDERRSSVAQVSISSDTLAELQRVDSL